MYGKCIVYTVITHAYFPINLYSLTCTQVYYNSFYVNDDH